MSNWKEYKLGDCIEFIVDNRGKNPPLSDNGYELIETISINSDNKYPDYNKVSKFVAKDIYDNWFRKGHPKTGDVLISTVGANIGKVSIMGADRGCIAQNLIGLRPDSSLLNSDYLYYFLIQSSTQHKLSSLNIGSAQPSIKVPHLLNISINVPNLTIQEKISNILSSLDEKIELNTQINQTLEQIAQAIFKSWFVDFDPVRAKAAALESGKTEVEAELAAMQAISGKTAEELAQMPSESYAELVEIAKAFPSEFGEDGVPMGWRLSTIGQEVETVGGATPSTKEEQFWNNGEIAWTTPKDLSSATSPVLLKTERKITELGLKKISSGLLPIGTVLLSSRAPVGYLSLAQIPVAINQGYIAIKCNKSLNNYYMLQWCKENLEEIKGRASGTTFLEISKTTFRQIPIIVPDGNVLSLFEKQCSSIYQSITVNAKENINLEKTRDLLLPRLLNGEIQL